MLSLISDSLNSEGGVLTRKSEQASKPGAYMTFASVARELDVSVESVRHKALVAHELTAVNVGNGGERAVWRVPRASFTDYCKRIEAEAARRFGSSAA